MKKNGFVMIETIVVITILSVGLISLYASYSLILTKVKMKSNYDNIEYIYKAYFVGEYLKTITDPGYNINYYDYNSVISDKFKIEQIYLITDGNYNDFETNILFYDGAMIAYIQNGFDFESGKLNVIVKFVDETDPLRRQINFASVAI